MIINTKYMPKKKDEKEKDEKFVLNIDGHIISNPDNLSLSKIIENAKAPTKTIYWSEDSLLALEHIKNNIDSSSLSKELIYIVGYYINFHDKENEYKTYEMNLTDGSKISILYPISESLKKVVTLSFVLSLYVKKLFFDNSIVMDSELTYFSFGRILYETIKENMAIDIWPLSFTETYTLNNIRDILSEGNIMLNQEIIKSSYHFTYKLISSTYGDEIYKLDSLISRTQDLDISVLTNKQIRETLDIMHSRRRLYVRILLVICNEMIRDKTFFSGEWLDKKFSVKTRDKLDILLSDPVVECNILMTMVNILNRF